MELVCEPSRAISGRKEAVEQTFRTKGPAHRRGKVILYQGSRCGSQWSEQRLHGVGWQEVCWKIGPEDQRARDECSSTSVEHSGSQEGMVNQERDQSISLGVA